MPIPDFDHNNCLPPFIGDPKKIDSVSPYVCNIIEFCDKFSTSQVRKDMLINFIEFRKQLNNYDVIDGFQWIGGSFSENIEASERRDPKDIDIITFFINIPPAKQKLILTEFEEFLYFEKSKIKYSLDHYPINLGLKPHNLVYFTRYWTQLFAHTRKNVWKGMLILPLNTPSLDEAALDLLKTKTI